jgi:acetylglutamate kinase
MTSKPTLQVVKIGGNVIDNPSALASFLQDFAFLPGPKLLVHGGGKIATQMAASMGIESQMIEGRRVTDEESLRIVTMVYAGWINKSIVAELQGLSCNALGLTGPDGRIVLSKKRAATPIDYGFVGDIVKVNAESLSGLVQAGFSPVFAPITADAAGQLLNTNADTMAQALAIALSSSYDVTLTYCFEKKGVLLDPNDDDSVISSIHPASFIELKEKGIVSAGVSVVRLCHADNLQKTEIGTKISA